MVPRCINIALFIAAMVNKPQKESLSLIFTIICMFINGFNGNQYCISS